MHTVDAPLAGTVEAGSLERWLLDPGAPLPPAPLLRLHHVASYAYTVAPPDAPVRAMLVRDHLAELARHRRVRAAVRSLAQAWSTAGIPLLVFKGFHLAEFTYSPGGRFYSDVDVLIRPEDEARAMHAAAHDGWMVDADTRAEGLPRAHCAYTLHQPGGWTEVDVHRRAVHQAGFPTSVPARVTARVWERARQRDWDGITVHEMAPVDALLVGVVLSRSWGDDWAIRASDPIDLRLFGGRAGIGPAELRARARELGCTRTLELFLERCDPWAGRLRLGPPPAAELWAWRLRIAGERGLLVEKPVGRLVSSTRTLAHVPGAVLLLRRVRAAAAAGATLAELLERFSPPARREVGRGSRLRRIRRVRAVWHAASMLRQVRWTEGVLRSVALYASLRAGGWPVEFVADQPGDAPVSAEGHAWLELDGRVLSDLQEDSSPLRYSERYRFPAA